MTEYNFQIDAAAVSDRGLSEKRPQNEDSFLEIAERGIFSVADGVGGAQAGEVASQMAMEILGEAFVNTRANSDAEEVMQIAISQANSSIYQMSRDLPQLSTMATTIVALHVAGNIATIGHVGDSRLYRLDGNGNLFRETQDHSVVEEEVRAGRMTPAQAANHPSRNVISRALGAEPTVEIDMKTIMFEPQTSFLLCSDGITRHIDDFELRQLLLLGGTPAEICSELKKLCYERGAEDNLTAVVVKISQAEARVPAEDLVPSFVETEESTVAAARPQTFDDDDSILEIDEAEIPTQNLQMPQTVDESQIPTAEYPTNEAEREENVIAPAEESAPVAEMPEEPAPVSADIAPQPAIVSEQVIKPDSEMLSSFEPEKTSSGGFFGKLLGSILLLLIGAALGAGGYYFYSQQNKPIETPPVPTVVDPTEAAISLFEKSRRTADDSPDKYIEAHKDKEGKNAEQLYLLGRAYLLKQNWAEAEKNFKAAQTQVKETGDHSRKVLENDINIGLIIATTELAQNKLKEQMNQNKNPANTATENKPKVGTP